MSTSSSLFDRSGGKILTFVLGQQEYGIQILEAREVVGMMRIDPVPRTPAWMRGVINLRGKIIPVVDLRARFDMPGVESTRETCIVVVDVADRLTGVIVDFLAGVATIEPDQFEAEVDLGQHVDVEYIEGIAKLDDRVILVLRMQNVLENALIAAVA